MDAILTTLFYPLVLVFALWCAREDGVGVRMEIRGHPEVRKMNVVCEKPDLKIPVLKRRR